jgi:carbonic anhydrase
MEKCMEPAGALKLLIKGNETFMNGKPTRPNQSARRRREVASGQSPFAIVVGCSDSRIPPELVFDRGIGDLFIVRTAGNVLDDAVLGSIEYAVLHLGVRLIVVLGHSSCGAVKAAMDDHPDPGHIPHLVNAIRPAVEKARRMSGDLHLNAVRANTAGVVMGLRNAPPILAGLAKKDRLKVIGAIYHLDSGKVEFDIRPCDWKKAKL